ncbi:hypothetical protein HWD35_18975 [Tsukamurella tyrosinosolvens]|uniref:hypothetical protein n=1 Tax=Tsukamurella tyrosinosolvens TaxID=57704 RepID=UPI001CE192E5|nr:hypothetical protein [Tsukamurella tyrosinosolvens]MCA4996803.1 hypothetical protein [Tsukamurella tyrosinosolvens]
MVLTTLLVLIDLASTTFAGAAWRSAPSPARTAQIDSGWQAASLEHIAREDGAAVAAAKLDALYATTMALLRAPANGQEQR